MKISILVEGPSDKSVMERLLRNGIERARHFLESGDIDHAFALPDLYPGTQRPVALRHSTADELRAVMRAALPDPRFHPHCLVHDLEALILATPDTFKATLGTKDRVEKGWSPNVEQQNHHRPPKVVVEELYKRYQKREYRDTVHAPQLLSTASVRDLAERCPDGFGRFVGELAALLGLNLTTHARSVKYL